MAHKSSDKPRKNEREEGGCVGGHTPGTMRVPLPNHHGMHERGGKGGDKPEKPKGP